MIIKRSKKNQEEAAIYERFRRPSSNNPFRNPYSFADFQLPEGQPPIVTEVFAKPAEVILAYFGILNQASNMEGYSGGCGSIGDGLSAYPYAYSLLSPTMRRNMTRKQFEDFFKGIGYITLLKLLPAYPSDGRTFMVEIETIQGEKESAADSHKLGGRFVYYYGIMTVQKTNQGYRISGIDLIPEDFLCAPEHNWFYMGEEVVQIVFGDNLHIIDKIEKTELIENMFYVYASGDGRKYRFDFVRITNGYDILLHENILENGTWKEIDIPAKHWGMKLITEQ